MTPAAATMPRVGLLPLARPTFDVAYAGQILTEALNLLDGLDAEVVGPRELLFDAEAVRGALPGLQAEPLDLLLILQVTFTDATMTVAAAEAIDAPIALWAFPEPRTGGRLRLNSLCGVNLAAHALGRAGEDCAWLLRDADDARATSDLARILAGERRAGHAAGAPAEDVDTAARAKAETARDRLAAARIGVVGEHPAGFDTCRYEPEGLAALTGTTAEPVALERVFAAAEAVPDDRASALRRDLAPRVAGLETMEAAATDGTLKVYQALADLAGAERYDGLAVRCWPEFFTERGCAACGAMSMMTDGGRPCGCEADVYGTLTSLALQAVADDVAFMTDMVDLDVDGDTAVLWHCGLAPLAMADPQSRPHATVHSNRRKPLLMEFPLKPGRVTVARFSQARNRPRLVLAGGEMLRAPMAFSGTSGTIRFDRPAGEVLDTVLAEGLEHHYAFAYGEHRPALRALAGLLDLPVLELT
ncbi:MAG: hypothetical protein RID91_09305 [Azospirillaceae bacterium]